jgi:hypothetical protein
VCRIVWHVRERLRTLRDQQGRRAIGATSSLLSLTPLPHRLVLGKARAHYVRVVVWVGLHGARMRRRGRGGSPHTAATEPTATEACAVDLRGGTLAIGQQDDRAVVLAHGVARRTQRSEPAASDEEDLGYGNVLWVIEVVGADGLWREGEGGGGRVRVVV